MSGNGPEAGQEHLFGVVTHLVNSALVSVEETPELAAFRMVDAANRLMSLLPPAETTAFVTASRGDFAEHAHLVMTDQDAFVGWLQGYVRAFVHESLTRNRGVGIGDPVG